MIFWGGGVCFNVDLGISGISGLSGLGGLTGGLYRETLSGDAPVEDALSGYNSSNKRPSPSGVPSSTESPDAALPGQCVESTPVFPIIVFA